MVRGCWTRSSSKGLRGPLCWKQPGGFVFYAVNDFVDSVLGSADTRAAFEAFRALRAAVTAEAHATTAGAASDQTVAGKPEPRAPVSAAVAPRRLLYAAVLLLR